MIKKILIYGTGTFFSKVLVFLMVPIYTRVFSPADYGYYDVLISNMQMLVSISFIEIWSGIIRFMYEEKDPYKPIHTFLFLFPILLTIYGVATFFLSFFMDFKYPISTILYGVTYLFFSVSNNVCRGLDKNMEYVLSGLISTFVSCSLSIAGAIVLPGKINILLYAQIIGFLFSIAFIEYRTRAYSQAVLKKTYFLEVKSMVLYCFPLMLNSFSFLFLGTFNKNIIIKNLGEAFSGYYAFALKFSAIISILISVYSLAWQEEAFVNAKKKDKGVIYSFYINAFMRFVGLAVPCYVVMVYFLAPFMGGERFVYALKYIPLAVVSAFLAEISGIFSVIIAVDKKTVQTLLSTILGAMINVLIVIGTVNHWGINASNIALSCGFGAAALSRYYFSKRIAYLKLEWHWLLLFGMEMILIMQGYYKDNLELMFLLGVLTIVVWSVCNYRFLKTLFERISGRV